AGRTFKYTDKGAVGLAGDKTVIVASSRGGVYSASAEPEAMAHQESNLRIIFGFFGITDVRIVRAEGTAMGDAARRAGIESALRAIPAVAAAGGRIAAWRAASGSRFASRSTSGASRRIDFTAASGPGSSHRDNARRAQPSPVTWMPPRSMA